MTKRIKKEEPQANSFHISQDELFELPMLCPLSKKQELFLNDTENDIIVFGGMAGAGKSEMSIMRALFRFLSDPQYTSCIARNTLKQLKNTGSLWPTMMNYFEKWTGKTISINRQEMEIRDTSTENQIRCHYLNNNQDDYQGMQITEYLLDEGTQIDVEGDYTYVLSRLRSKCTTFKEQSVITCNPKRTHWLKYWLVAGGYIDEETGLPVPEMDGVTTYMLQIDGKYRFFKSKQDIIEQYGEEEATDASKFVFYSAGVLDNPWILKHKPAYVRKLRNLPALERMVLFEGCWNAEITGKMFFDRTWVKVVPKTDILHVYNLPSCRAWDFAATKPTPNYPNPDWTRGTKCAWDETEQTLYVMGVKSLRDRPAMVQKLVEDTFEEDGKDVLISIPQDPGAAGKESTDNKIARLSRKGAKVLVSKTRNSKFERASEFLISAQNGRVVIVDDGGEWVEDFLLEWERWDGATRSKFKDDIIDSTVDAFKQLKHNCLIPVIRFNKSAKQFGNTLI